MTLRIWFRSGELEYVAYNNYVIYRVILTDLLFHMKTYTKHDWRLTAKFL